MLISLQAYLHRHRRKWVGFAFILPWIIAALWFDLIPFMVNLLLSFTDYSVSTSAPDWTGIKNFDEIFTLDPLFQKSLGNTVYYLALSVPVRLVAALAIALLLNLRIRALGTFRTIFYVPSVVPLVAVSIIFFGMFNARYGIFNQVLILFDLPPVRWLTRPEWIKPAMVIMSTWGFGAQMVIFLAGLQGIASELYEAAEMDGGNYWQKLFRITIPMLTPVIFFNLIIGIIGGFQVFAAAYVLLGPGGGPLNSGLFYVIHIYNNAFSYFRLGYAAALSLILFLIILFFTIILVRTSDRWVYYGDT